MVCPSLLLSFLNDGGRVENVPDHAWPSVTLICCPHTGEQNELTCRTYITQLKDLRLQLEGCEARTVARIRQPVDKEPLRDCAQRATEQKVWRPLVAVLSYASLMLLIQKGLYFPVIILVVTVPKE